MRQLIYCSLLFTGLGLFLYSPMPDHVFWNRDSKAPNRAEPDAQPASHTITAHSSEQTTADLANEENLTDQSHPDKHTSQQPDINGEAVADSYELDLSRNWLLQSSADFQGVIIDKKFQLSDKNAIDKSIRQLTLSPEVLFDSETGERVIGGVIHIEVPLKN